jgi:hypothetical protein
MRDLAPAMLIGVCLTCAAASTQLVPIGEELLLVRLKDPGPDAALSAALAAEATLVTIPAPGFAVLYGDASRTRAALGLTTLWRGSASCSTTP